jgi:hypothetical protein
MDVDRLIERDVAAEPLVLKLSRAIGESTACIVKVKLRGEVIASVGHHGVADPRGYDILAPARAMFSPSGNGSFPF